MNQVKKAEWFLIFVTLIWGGTFVSIKTALAFSSPLLLMGLRFFAAFLFFIPLNRIRISSFSRSILIKGVFLGFLMYLGYGLQTLGLQYTTASRSGFVTYFYALMTPFFQFLIMKKKPFWGNMTGLAVAFFGLFLITGGMGSGAFNTGDSITLLSAAAFSLYIVFLNFLSGKEDPGPLTAIQLFTTSVFSFLSLLFFEKPVLSPTFSLWANILYLSLLGGVVAVYVMTRFQNAVTPTRAALLYSLEPVFSALLGVLLLKESFGPKQIGGAALILCGVLISEIFEIPRKGRKRVLNSSD